MAIRMGMMGMISPSFTMMYGTYYDNGKVWLLETNTFTSRIGSELTLESTAGERSFI
jgi:hypothetical protein